MELAFPFFAGILAFLSPCLIPMITVYLSLITGLTADELLAEETQLVRRHIVINTAGFVAGFAIIYIAAGAAAGLVGRVLSVYQTQLNQIGGVIIILLGLHFAGLLKWLPVDPLGWLRRPGINAKAAPGAAGSVGVGVLFAVACSHCFGGLLTSVLVYAGVSGSQSQGALSLALFSLGLAIPFMITAFAVSAVVERLRAAQRHIRPITIAGGLFLVVFGALTFMGRYTVLVDWMGRLSPMG